VELFTSKVIISALAYLRESTVVKVIHYLCLLIYCDYRQTISNMTELF